MKDAKPFPVPKTFPCPYCGEKARRTKLRDTGIAFFSHHIEERKLVGQATFLTLYTIHYFAAKWDGEEWKLAPKVGLGSSKVCERLGDFRGNYTDWTSCDKDD